MARTKTSQHHSYKQPLLVAMSALTGGQPNVKVRNNDAAEKTCEVMGIAIDAYGKQEQTGQWWPVRWATLAMLELKQAGLMDFPTKGWWVLTQAGVDQAALSSMVTPAAPVQAPAAPVAVAATVAAPVAPADVAQAPAVKVKVVKAPVAPAAPVQAPVAVLAPQIAQDDAGLVAEDQAYLLTVQMAATPCFSNWSGASDQCKICPLAGKCYGAMLSVLSSLASSLPLTVDLTPKPEPVKVEPPAPEVKLDIPVEYIEMQVAAETICSHCSQPIAKGTTGAYRKRHGFSHLACARKAAGLPE